jgi:hypothetical protein
MTPASPNDDPYAIYYRLSPYLTILSQMSLAKPKPTPIAMPTSATAVEAPSAPAVPVVVKPVRVRCSRAAQAGQVATPGCTLIAMINCSECNAAYCQACDASHHATAPNNSHKRLPHEQVLEVFLEQVAELKELLSKKDAELNEARGLTPAAIPTAPPLSSPSSASGASSSKSSKESDKKSLWTPLTELTTLIENVQDVLQLYGATTSDGILPYDRASFKLHNVASIAGVAPRSHHGKKQRVKVEASKKSSSASGVTVWASGTGYGHGSEDAASTWDPSATRAAQERKDKAIATSLEDVVKELNSAVLPPGFATALEQSAVIPVLEQYLANDSLSELEKNTSTYNTVLSVLTAMLKHAETARLFHQLPNQRVSLQSMLANLADQARIVVKLGRLGEAKPKAVDVVLIHPSFPHNMFSFG